MGVPLYLSQSISIYDFYTEERSPGALCKFIVFLHGSGFFGVIITLLKNQLICL